MNVLAITSQLNAYWRFMYLLTPGHILQLQYLKRRLKKQNHHSFIEFGSGIGYVSHELLKLGLQGRAYDLNVEACERSSVENAVYIKKNQFQVCNADFLEAASKDKVDLIISVMVLEHLTDQELQSYFKKCRELLNPDGIVVNMVPASPAHWGVEDDIAGHLRRYTFASIRKLASDSSFEAIHVSGLTYPLSNCLLGLSNYLVKRSESQKLNLSKKEQTVSSGHRDVPFKTSFPKFIRYLVNPFTLFPFYFLQILNKNNPSSLVIYSEFKKR